MRHTPCGYSPPCLFFIYVCRGRCPHRPVWEPSNSPQIFVKTVRTARADVGIGPYRTVSNIGTNSYSESYSFAPEEGVQAAERPKIARVSAQYNASPAPLFAYFFWRSRKSRSPKAQLQCCCKNGTPVNPDKRADVGIGPYKVRYKPPPEAARYEITMLCSVIDS